MKNFKLNLKGLYGFRQSLLSRSPQPRDNREMSERKPSEERTLLAPLPQRFVRYVAMLIMLLTLGVGQMWAWWYVPGQIHSNGWSTSTAANGGITQMNSSNEITFYNVPAGTYEFKLVKDKDGGGQDWGHGNFTNKSSSIITALCSNCQNNNNKITTNAASDITFKITNESSWNCDVTASSPTYYIKYDWNNSGWRWSGALTSNGSNLYSCTGQYGLSGSYDHTRLSSTDQDGTNSSATVNNSPSKGDKCVFVYNSSTNALTITRCNKVTATNHVYFDNSTSNFSNNLYFVIGHDKPTAYSKVYQMTRVAGTNYYHASVGDTWDDATYYAVIASSSNKSTVERDNQWGSSSLSSKGSSGYTAAYTGKYDLGGDNHVYTITTASTGSGQAMTITYQDAGLGFFNKAQTLHVMFSNDGGSTYSDVTTTAAAWRGTITAERKYLDSDYGTVVDHTGASKETLSSSAYVKDAIIGSNYVLAETSTATGYTFAGWGNSSSATPDGNASKTLSSISGTNNIYAFFKANQYTVTINDHGASSGPGNQTVTYNEVPSDVTPPVKAGFGFDGYWTQETGGIQVIDATGHWKAGVAYHTDGDKKWCHDGGQTIHAHWLAPGYYAVGEFNNWEVQGVMTATGVANEVAWESNDIDKESEPFIRGGDNTHEMYRKSYFKIRQVAAGDGSTDTWYGLNSSNEFGKGITKTIKSGENNMKLQIYYSGKYTFKLNTSSKSLTVIVPVINRLEIYNIDEATSGTVDGHTLPWLTDDWDEVDANTVTKTVQLERGKYYNFKPVYDSYYYGKTPEAQITYNATPPSVSSLVAGQDNLKITADLKGNYKFDFNHSTKTLTVTYPTRRQVNYSAITKVNGTGNSAVLTAENDDDSDYAISNGGYVADGNSVTFRAPAANIGYTFRGWFSKDNPSDWEDGLLEDDADYTVTINADLTVYAVYSENDYTVTVNATTGGSITTPAEPATTVTAHPATGTPIVAAKADEGWHFTGWTSASDKVTFADEHALTTTVTTTADATIQANFVRRYALYGSRDNGSDPDTKSGLPGWSPNEPVDFTGTVTTLGTADGANLTYAATLEPNKKYKFQVYDRALSKYRGASADNAVLPAEANPSAKIYNNWELNAGTPKDVHIYTVGYGTYTFHITKISNDDNRYPSIQVDRQSSKQLTLGKKVIYNNDNSSLTNADTEGTVTAKVVENEPETGTPTDYFLTSGQYYADGSDITFAAETATGYKIVGWYSDVSCSTPYEHDGSTIIISTNGAKTESTLVLKNCTTAKTVYVKFEEIMTAVTISHNTHGHVTVGGEIATSTTVGITTTRALVAVPDAGYYFAGWTVPVGADFELQDKDDEDEEDPEVTLLGLGAGTAGTLTANFVEEDKIYFRNIDQSTGEKLWDKDNIYVYFATTWYDGKGVQTLSNYAEMSPAFDTKIYWAYVPHAFTKSGNTHVAFSDVDMHGYTEFHENKGVYRTDYSRITNMFVPHHTTSGTTNWTVYHSNGYWKVYDPKVGVGQGYYLQLHTGDDGKGRGTYTEKGQFTAVADGSSKISYTMRVDNTSKQTQYRIASAGGVHYTANATITTAARENVKVNEYKNCDNCYFTVTLTSEGDYTFILDQSEDYMKLTVDYPVSVGDYRLKHTYNDGSDKTTYSNVIKSSDASTSRTLSMYLSTEGSKTLVLQKCTTIVAGVPVWDEGDDTNLSGVLTTVGTNGNGVYKFDVSVSADKVSSAPTATLYTGPYYIKTDGATGGWVNYTQNGMTENTLNFDAEHPEKSFNYYYCKYYSDAGTNLKCVIANEYCNALTDTLIGDAVIGMGNQTTPSAVSVRFSYNSYTNEIKRSYLGASMKDDFLRIEGNTTASAKHIYDKNETTYIDANADSYIKFEDKQNWRYEIIIKADVNARAKLTASFNGQTQYFMGAAGESGHEWDDANTEQLFGGAGGTYGLTLVYDFKTNKLIRAWKPTGSTIRENLTLESDVLLLREHQGAPAEITFGKIGETDVYASLKEVKTVYSVLRFNRWRLNNLAHPEDVDTEHCKTADLINEHHAALNPGDAGYLPQAERELYFISFPYDVKMSDIIHFGGYYDTWGIMYYDGKNRAKNGYWIDSESNWKYFTPEEFATDTLNAYEGYLIGIDLDQMRYDNTSFWTNNSSEVDIYFPSKEPVSTITQQAVTVNIDTVGYQCTINRAYGGSDGDRRIKDSHWHCIGVPAYADLSHAINNGEPNDAAWTNKELLYLYEWNPVSNDHSIKDASTFNFQAMYAYLVQYAGTTLSWAAAAVSPATPAARRMKTEELRDRQFNLQLMQGDKETDHTYIRLSDDEEVTTGFEFNHDVSKMMLTGANIYTLIGKEQAAANSLPLNMTQTTVVPVGVKIATAGDYTFAIPEGTDGVGVVLIDNIAGTRTNLALTDYTVSLTTGKIENRFSLEISPIQHTPTGIENAGDGVQDGVRKVVVDGILYIVRDGKVFDARGNRVK